VGPPVLSGGVQRCRTATASSSSWGEYLANAEERKRYRALFRRQALLAKYRAGDRGIWGGVPVREL